MIQQLVIDHSLIFFFIIFIKNIGLQTIYLIIINLLNPKNNLRFKLANLNTSCLIYILLIYI